MESTRASLDMQDRLARATEFAMSTGKAVSCFGGRLAVLCAFVDAVMPRLGAAQSREIGRHFRVAVERAMSLTDDVAMPADYHAAFLEQTNELLALLESKRPA